MAGGLDKMLTLVWDSAGGCQSQTSNRLDVSIGGSQTPVGRENPYKKHPAPPVLPGTVLASFVVQAHKHIRHEGPIFGGRARLPFIVHEPAGQRNGGNSVRTVGVLYHLAEPHSEQPMVEGCSFA